MSNSTLTTEGPPAPLDKTLVDARTAPLPVILTPPAVVLAAPTGELTERVDGPRASSAELREFIATLRRDRKHHDVVRRLKRTAWALAALAVAAYLVQRGRPFRVAPPVASAPAAFDPTPLPGFDPPPPPPAFDPPAAAEVRPTTTTPDQGPLETAAGCEESFARQRWKSAVETCSRQFEDAPGAGLALRIAHAHWARGQAHQAGLWARRALALGNHDADAFVLIGHAEREAGHARQAAAAYRRYLQTSPRGWHARRLRAALRELRRHTAYRQPSALRDDQVIR